MARATGSINYLEHRTPLKDESGKYQIHPMFVKRDIVDREKMETRVRDHYAMNVSSFISALETLEDETLYALAEGNEVRVGDMFIVKPKLGMVKHKDKNGIEWKRTYHEGDLIPANEVDICGLEIQPTKEFLERLKRHSNGCSRQYWSVKSTPKEADKEFADIVEICQQQGYITVKDMIREFGVTRYHANKVLNDLCEEPAARMYATREGPITLYRLWKKE